MPNLRFHADIEDGALVHGTYWGGAGGLEVEPFHSTQTRRVLCDGAPLLMMQAICDATEDMITCLECLVKLR
jgi:hypothetical protein